MQRVGFMDIWHHCSAHLRFGHIPAFVFRRLVSCPICRTKVVGCWRCTHKPKLRHWDHAAAGDVYRDHGAIKAGFLQQASDQSLLAWRSRKVTRGKEVPRKVQTGTEGKGIIPQLLIQLSLWLVGVLAEELACWWLHTRRPACPPSEIPSKARTVWAFTGRPGNVGADRVIQSLLNWQFQAQNEMNDSMNSRRIT